MTLFVSAAVLGLALAAPAKVRGPLPGYLELVHAYARGDRAQAVAGLGSWSMKSLEGQFGEVSRLVAQAERCRCPTPLEGVSLRAAILLHMDRDRAEQPASEDAEQPRPCPGRHARLANRYAALLARLPDGGDFARRYFLAMVLRCQWDYCLEEALPFGNEGLALFPRDSELLLAVGSVYEEGASLGMAASRTQLRGLPEGQHDNDRVSAIARRRWMVEARRFLADAVAADGSNALARLRLGRVLDRLGEREPARKELEEALRLSQQPEIRFLAQLFAGHLHEEEGRVPEAAEAYRLARVIDPGSQSAAVALAHVLQLAGEAEQARGALEPAVDPGRRTSRDAYWDYLMGNALHGEELVDALRRESLE